MKKKILVGFAVVGLITTTMLAKETTYPHMGFVTEVDYLNDKVTVTDLAGRRYQFDGAEDWMVNDICSMTMFTKFTKRVSDDMVLEVRYDGYEELINRRIR